MKKPRNARGSPARPELGRAGLDPPHCLAGSAQSQTHDLLFEIGTEELPAAYLPAAITQLREEGERLLREAHLAFTAVQSHGTPRRLVLIVTGLDATQHNPPEEIRGPSKQAAYDAQGAPTPALAGFLKGRGGTLTQTTIVSTEKGGYVYLTKPAKQVPAAAVLPALLSQLITRLRFPKTMRWDDSGVRFARPVRWLVALYGSTPLRVRFGRLAGGRTTIIGGPTQPRAVSVRDAAHYLALLKRQGIIVDADARARQIQGLLNTLAKTHHGVAATESVTYGLLEEVTHLVEQPVAFAGRFDPRYLSLPREVLLASMAKYQRIFAVQTKAGRLLPAFIAMLDGRPRSVPAVQRAYEHVLNARLTDSLLFLKQDRERLPLDRLLPSLREVTFHQKLGSMADKSHRVVALGEALAQLWQLTAEERAHLRRACELAKADLVTTMVREFPTLQGIIGKSYALDAGEPTPVAHAIEEQYLPLAGRPPLELRRASAGDLVAERLPKTLIGSALAIVDKFDTLTGYFAIGIEPTGDQDPFGLRRCAQGIVEVAWAVHRSLLVPMTPRVKQYLGERLYTFAWPAPVPSRDVIDAVLGSPWDDLVDAMERIVALTTLTGSGATGLSWHSGLAKAAKVIERTRNMLKGATLTQSQVDPAQFHDPFEHQLWQAYQAQHARLTHLMAQRAYAEATTLYGETFFEPLHAFFDHVLVNVKEDALQQNRLALLKTINTLYTDRVADLSKLAILQTHEVIAR